jgi:perosamine synthetase
MNPENKSLGATEPVALPTEQGSTAHSGPIPLCVPHLGGNEWQYLKECLDTNWVSSAGPFVTRFETMMADYVGAKYAVATTSGTAALHVALLVAGVQPEDEVVVPTLTFIATVNAIRYVGAWPVFIDAEPDYWQMDPLLLAEFLEKGCQWHNGGLTNRVSGRHVKAILPVHLLGHPCDMDPILEMSLKYNLVVVEDATESLGAMYQGRMVGHLGDIACFSFNGNKMITTGSGGMIVTDNQSWARKAEYLTTQAKDDPVEYVHHQIGYNYRLSNLQASLGCAQLEQIDKHIQAKREIAAIYRNSLMDHPGLTPMTQAPWAASVFWLFTVLVNEESYGMDSRALLGLLARRGIQSRPLFQPGHLSPAHTGAQAYQQGVAERLYRDALSLPCSVGLDRRDLERVLYSLRCLPSDAHLPRQDQANIGKFRGT